MSQRRSSRLTSKSRSSREQSLVAPKPKRKSRARAQQSDDDIVDDTATETTQQIEQPLHADDSEDHGADDKLISNSDGHGNEDDDDGEDSNSNNNDDDDGDDGNNDDGDDSDGNDKDDDDDDDDSEAEAEEEAVDINALVARSVALFTDKVKALTMHDSGKNALNSTEYETIDDFVEAYAKDNNAALEKLLKTSLVGSDYRRPPANPSAERAAKRQLEKRRRETTSGSGWFGLESAPLTESNKQELRVLELQPYLMNQQRMKRTDREGFPSFFQVGRVIESKQEFYSSRIPKKQRQRSFVDELISDTTFKSYIKNKSREKQKANAFIGKKRRQLQQYHQSKRAKRSQRPTSPPPPPAGKHSQGRSE